MNLKHKVLTGNPTGNSRCQALASRALNTSCYFGQSTRSIESRCVVKLSLFVKKALGSRQRHDMALWALCFLSSVTASAVQDVLITQKNVLIIICVYKPKSDITVLYGIVTQNISLLWSACCVVDEIKCVLVLTFSCGVVVDVNSSKTYTTSKYQILWQTNSVDPKETSWGLKGPVAYLSYHCVSLKNRFLLKRYVFLKNIVLHNIMCETNWIVITTKFYK